MSVTTLDIRDEDRTIHWPSGLTDWESREGLSWSRQQRSWVPRSPFLQLSTGSATSETILPDSVQIVTSATGASYLTIEGSSEPVLRVDLVNRRWLRLKWSHFTRSGRQRRIQAALDTLRRPRVGYNVHPDVVRWAAEDVDIEDM